VEKLSSYRTFYGQQLATLSAGNCNAGHKCRCRKVCAGLYKSCTGCTVHTAPPAS